MEIEIKFEYPHTDWSVLHVFKGFYDYLASSNNITYINSSKFSDRYQGGVNSAHIMTIKNPINKKYIIISYWDKIEDFFLPSNGWDIENCVDVITSSGIKNNFQYTPFTYLPYLKIFDGLLNYSKKMSEKTNDELIFRGYLYGERLSLKNEGILNITDKKIFSSIDYYNDLTNTKICLSLNGAGEICNRDIEILSARSVLLRPILNCEFHNKLIPNYHYIPFEKNDNPKIQSEIILEKYNEIKNNIDLLTRISENGYQWFLENGTITSNIQILKNTVNLNKIK